MEILNIQNQKRNYLPLLLLADEQEDMINRYLDRGELFALMDPELKTVCVVTQEENRVFEIKNLATVPEAQNQGFGKRMVEFICRHYRGRCDRLLVGTGDSPLTIPFYEKCGFQISHRVPNFFLDHYDHPIFEGGKRLIDMIYLEMALSD